MNMRLRPEEISNKGAIPAARTVKLPDRNTAKRGFFSEGQPPADEKKPGNEGGDFYGFFSDRRKGFFDEQTQIDDKKKGNAEPENKNNETKRLPPECYQ